MSDTYEQGASAHHSDNHERNQEVHAHNHDHHARNQEVHAHNHDHHARNQEVHAHDHDHSAHAHRPHDDAELLALLTYMVKHNKHHAEELAELGQSVDGKAAEYLAAAIADFRAGNDKLDLALALLQQ